MRILEYLRGAVGRNCLKIAQLLATMSGDRIHYISSKKSEFLRTQKLKISL